MCQGQPAEGVPEQLNHLGGELVSDLQFNGQFSDTSGCWASGCEVLHGSTANIAASKFEKSDQLQTRSSLL